MTGRKLALWVLVALVVVVALNQRSGGSHGARSLPRTDQWGDPFVTYKQVAGIRMDMGENKVLRLLGGEGSNDFYVNGPHVSNSVPGPTGLVLTFDYPLRGMDSPGSKAVSDSIVWWRICLQRGRVVGERLVEPSDRVVGCWS